MAKKFNTSKLKRLTAVGSLPGLGPPEVKKFKVPMGKNKAGSFSKMYKGR